jgi:hypothetical protein
MRSVSILTDVGCCTSRDPVPERVLSAAFLTLAWFWLLAPTQNPWYWTWALPLLPFARSRLWSAVSLLAMAYYARFWFRDVWPDATVFQTGYDGASFYDFVVLWCLWFPWYVLLAIAQVRVRGRTV